MEPVNFSHLCSQIYHLGTKLWTHKNSGGRFPCKTQQPLLEPHHRQACFTTVQEVAGVGSWLSSVWFWRRLPAGSSWCPLTVSSRGDKAEGPAWVLFTCQLHLWSLHAIAVLDYEIQTAPTLSDQVSCKLCQLFVCTHKALYLLPALGTLKGK